MPRSASSTRPGLAVVRAGERALLVAEDLRLEQRVGQRGAVDRLEVLAAAAAQLVDHPRDDFLARAGRAEDQHRDVGLGRRADPLEDDQHLLVAADHFAEALHRRRLVFGADRRAPLEERVEQPRARSSSLGPRGAIAAAARPGTRRDDAEVDELASGSCRRRAACGRTSPSALRRRTTRRGARSGSAAVRRAAATARARGRRPPPRCGWPAARLWRPRRR